MDALLHKCTTHASYVTVVQSRLRDFKQDIQLYTEEKVGDENVSLKNLDSARKNVCALPVLRNVEFAEQFDKSLFLFALLFFCFLLAQTF